MRTSVQIRGEEVIGDRTYAVHVRMDTDTSVAVELEAQLPSGDVVAEGGFILPVTDLIPAGQLIEATLQGLATARGGPRSSSRSRPAPANAGTPWLPEQDDELGPGLVLGRIVAQPRRHQGPPAPSLPGPRRPQPRPPKDHKPMTPIELMFELVLRFFPWPASLGGEAPGAGHLTFPANHASCDGPRYLSPDHDDCHQTRGRTDPAATGCPFRLGISGHLFGAAAIVAEPLADGGNGDVEVVGPADVEVGERDVDIGPRRVVGEVVDRTVAPREVDPVSLADLHVIGLHSRPSRCR